MSDHLFLIAHKVRGLPAFDIAQHLTCPKCNATDDHCTSCDGVGHWWIVPTSGHRAWPYENWLLSSLCVDISYPGEPEVEYVLKSIPSMPPSLRDHYTTEREAAINLVQALGLDKPSTPPAPLIRRL